MIRSALKSVVRVLALPVRLVLFTGAADAADPVKVRLLAFSRVGGEVEVGIADMEGRPLVKKPVTLPTRQLSDPASVSARALMFTAPADAAKILGKVTLLATGSEFVLIFLPAKADAPHPYQVDAVALPENEFGGSDYAFINYSGATVGCNIDGDKLVVPHGKCAIYQGEKSGKGGGNRPIDCYLQKDGAWESKPFFSSRIVIQERVRNLVLICLNPSTGKTDFRGITDYVER